MKNSKFISLRKKANANYNFMLKGIISSNVFMLTGNSLMAASLVNEALLDKGLASVLLGASIGLGTGIIGRTREYLIDKQGYREEVQERGLPYGDEGLRE